MLWKNNHQASKDHQVDNLHLLVYEWGLTTWVEREKKVVLNEYYILKSSPKYYFFEKVQISLSNNMMRGLSSGFFKIEGCHWISKIMFEVSN